MLHIAAAIFFVIGSFFLLRQSVGMVKYAHRYHRPRRVSILPSLLTMGSMLIFVATR
jgi:multisubunit Na+/H+ antiporter MnhG subunit